MVRVIPNEATLGCRVEGLDLSRPLDEGAFRLVLRCFADHGVVCFPDQHLDPAQHKAFASRFGSLEVNVAAGRFVEPGHPEVMILSNILRDGQPIGLGDAGQGWHTDMSYSRTIAFLNVLHALEVPQRDGRTLGATRFADMRAAYDGLPAPIKQRIEGRTATHDFDKFWEMMRARPGSTRPPLSTEQRASKPPVSHPIVLAHPLSGRKALYCNVGYAVRIDGLPEPESEALLAQLFEHQLRPEYQYSHRWRKGDVLAWDNLWTMHDAVADYRPEEPRLMRRCQVMADRVFAGRWD
jgi:taurine dioxygenase